MAKFSPRNKYFLFLFLILAIAFYLRIFRLTSLPVFADEAIYIRWSQIMSSESTLRFLPLSDGKQPLFMWILMLIVKHFRDPLFAGRIISVFSGLGTLIGAFSLSYYLFRSKLSATVTALIWAISPFVLFFDRMALVDSLLAMWAVWTLLFSVVTMKTKRLDFAMISGFFLGFAALTKSPALFMALFIPLSGIFIFKDATLSRGNLKNIAVILGLTAVIYAIAGAMYNILRLGPNFHLLYLRSLDYVYPYGHVFSSPFDPFKGHIMGIFRYFVKFVPVGVLLLAIGALYANWKKYTKEVLVLLFWGFLPILITAEYSKVVTARYILYTLPPIIVLAGSIFLSGRKILRKLGVAFFGVFVFQALVVDYLILTDINRAPLPQGERNGYLEEWTAGQGLVEISEYLKSVAAVLPSGKKIVVGTEGYFGTLPNGLEMYTQGSEKIVVVGVGLAISEVPQGLRESYDSGNKTYLVVNKSRLNADPSKIGLKLLMQFDKPMRTPGSVEYIDKGDHEVLYLFEVVK